MGYSGTVGLSDDEFRRLTGIKRCTFMKMVEVLTSAAMAAKDIPKWRGGRNPVVSIEDKLMICLEYWREYRTMFHIAVSYGVSESSCWRAVRWVENTLIQEGTFSLPGRKALLRSDNEYSVVVVDATETPVERPKKNRSDSTRVRKSDTR